jgi:predicted Zn-dependent protease
LSAQLLSNTSDASLYLERGKLFYEHQDWKVALRDFERAGELDPTLEIIDFHRGRTLLETGSPGPAKALLDRYLNRHPDDILALVARARALMRLREPRAAAREFDLVIGQSPKGEYFYERAQALQAAGDIDEALRGLDMARRSLGVMPHLEVLAMDLEIQRERYDAALDRLDRVLTTTPRPEFWLARKADILRQAGRFEEARTVIIDALTTIERRPLRLRQERATRELEKRLRLALERLTADRNDIDASFKSVNSPN